MISLAGKLGIALFEKRFDAFGEILALESNVAQELCSLAAMANRVALQSFIGQVLD
jgi:hypothetical protein